MTHALVTVVAPLDLAKLREAETAIDRLGNPARSDLLAALDRLDGEDGTHFASLHAFKSVDGARGYILLEMSADGTEQAALERIVAAIGADLRNVFLLATDWTNGRDLGAYLLAHRVEVGGGLFDNPGLAFAGTPGMSVGRIRTEDRVGRAVAAILKTLPMEDPLDCLVAVRGRVAADPAIATALRPANVAPPFALTPTATLVPELVGSFASTYLKQVAAVVVAIALAVGAYDAWTSPTFWRGAGAFVAGSVSILWGSFWILLILFAGFALYLYLKLRQAEADDFVDEHLAGPNTNRAMFERENVYAQNHMISVTQRKPGLVRWFTIRLIFWAIGALAPRLYQPGFLGKIGTIHFARWVTPPGSMDLVFLSNFGGSWESYLEDFITRAHAGLTGVWSNCIGFPRTENLVQLGATDGDRFKRFARHSMVPTRFWYCAYPNLTTDAIRSNAKIRAGLSGAMTEDEARSWLALFASASRPAEKLVSSDIQSIMFGGFGFMPFSTCLVLDFPEDGHARDWLRAVQPRLAFNDGRRVGGNAVANLAFGPRGLKRLGLPPEGLATFPFAFLGGMTTDHRARILGDAGANASEHWWWGREQSDAVLLLYGRSEEEVGGLEADLAALARDHGLVTVYRRAMKPVIRNKAEPFGFVDGGSQPVVRGTYKALRNADSIHIVEAGEFILGYPDNRGYMPLTPTLPALKDPDDRLPLKATVDAGFTRTVVEDTRDLGFNGSYLVIRELEQDVAGFEAYCQSEARRLKGRLPPPYNIDAEFVGAKMLGRWKDGSSLVRHPYESQTARRAKVDENAKKARVRDRRLMIETAAPMTRPESKAADAPAIGAAPLKNSAQIAYDDGTVPEPSYADNDFLFGAEDPEALNCPFGAHVRRANPRDSLDPSSSDQINISNRHRIMRIGRQYVPIEGQRPGLFFMCLNGDIERQFEFLQQTWLRSPSFHGLSCQKDPILGDAEEGSCDYSIPSRYGPTYLSPVPRFVTTRGGGYFFLPGRRLLDYLVAIP